MLTGAIVLAAGKASRFGSPKQLLELGGETLLDRACRIAMTSGCQPVLRVLGAHADLIQARACPEGVGTLFHPEWEDGMGSSLAAGLAKLLEGFPQLELVFVLLADQPLVSVELLATMKKRVIDEGASAVICDYGEATGPPVLFRKEQFGDVLVLSGDRGAKSVANACGAEEVPFEGGAWDIDYPENWERLKGELGTE